MSLSDWTKSYSEDGSEADTKEQIQQRLRYQHIKPELVLQKSLLMHLKGADASRQTFNIQRQKNKKYPFA
jgi:hypothetical protein